MITSNLESYIICFATMTVLHSTSADNPTTKCTNLYLIIEQDMASGNFSFKQLTDVSLLDYPLLNTKEEYNTIQNEKNCFIEIRDCHKQITNCTPPLKTTPSTIPRTEISTDPSNFKETETTISSDITNVGVEITTSTENIAKAEYLEMEKKKKESIKTGFIATGAAMGTVSLAFLAKKILYSMQAGTYQFPDV